MLYITVLVILQTNHLQNKCWYFSMKPWNLHNRCAEGFSSRRSTSGEHYKDTDIVPRQETMAQKSLLSLCYISYPHELWRPRAKKPSFVATFHSEAFSSLLPGPWGNRFQQIGGKSYDLQIYRAFYVFVSDGKTLAVKCSQLLNGNSW